jgi:uncharacterized protein
MHIGLIVKATRLCNLRCTYCHEWRTGRDQVMPFEVLLSLISGALQDLAHQSVEFIWHGGETTLLPISFYEKAVFLQSQFRHAGQIVHNTIQTNGTRLTSDWISFFRANQFAVGVSLDGPPELNDRLRVYRSGRGSSAEIRRGMDLLREGGVAFSVLMVIDEDALEMGPDRIFDFLLNSGIKSVGLLAAKPRNEPSAVAGTEVSHYVDPKRMSAFLKGIYDRWIREGERSIHIRELEFLRAKIRGDGAGFCTLSGNCLGQYFLVEPNGTVAHCDLFDGDDRYTLGNVVRENFASIRSAEKLESLRSNWQADRKQMSACPEFGVCQGWCPHENYVSKRHNLSHSRDCCGLRDLIGHIRSNMVPEWSSSRMLPLMRTEVDHPQ